MATATTMLRVNADTRAILQDLARKKSVSMQEIVRRAVETYRREQLMAAAAAGYAALRANPSAWQEYQEEMASLDGALADGLDDIYEDDLSASPASELERTPVPA